MGLGGAGLRAVRLGVMRVLARRGIARRTFAVLAAPASAAPASAAAAALAIAFAIGVALARSVDGFALGRSLARLAVLIVGIVCGRAVRTMILSGLAGRIVLAGNGLRTIGPVAFSLAVTPRAPPAPPAPPAAAFRLLAPFAV